MKHKRRNFLIAGLAGGAGLLGYSAHRGVRIPPMIWEPNTHPNSMQMGDVFIGFDGLIQTRTPVIDTANALHLRAYTLEPSLSLGSLEQDQRLIVSVNNIHPNAYLVNTNKSSSQIRENISGITRIVEITLTRGSQLNLQWQLPQAEQGYTFAAIGDTGGQQELDWCIQRAHQLGASFLLHLGDFYYAPGDYDRAIQMFNNAPLPCFVSIGNHDFHDGQTIYQQFLDDVGPFNSHFEYGNVRFINIDTASNILPYASGPRGTMLKSLAQQPAAVSNIAFTHRPLFDPIENSSHDIGSNGERDWLIKQIKACGVNTLLSGHIHIYARDTIQNIDNIIVGQGLGHQDLITNADYSKIALAQVSSDGQVNFEFPTLAMPWEVHCHPRTDVVKESIKDLPHYGRVKQLESACLEQPMYQAHDKIKKQPITGIDNKEL